MKIVNNNTQQALAQWLGTRLKHWQQLDEQLKQRGKDPESEVDDARLVLNSFRSLLTDLSLARRNLSDGAITRYLESLFIRSREVIYRPPNQYRLRLLHLYSSEIPELMWRLKGPLITALMIFTVAIISGWLMVAAYPELVGLFASTEMIDHVQAGKLWTDDLLNIAPSSILSLGIMANNIMVSLFAFALGALYGVGTLYILSLNGMMLGAVFAFCHQYEMDQRLFEFIIGHGVVELSVIIIAAAMGLQLGESLIRPGDRNRLQAFQETTVDAGKVLMAAVPFLVLAGLIEGYISPDPRYHLLERVMVGISSGILFWIIMLFGIRRSADSM